MSGQLTYLLSTTAVERDQDRQVERVGRKVHDAMVKASAVTAVTNGVMMKYSNIDLTRQALELQNPGAAGMLNVLATIGAGALATQLQSFADRL